MTPLAFVFDGRDIKYHANLGKEKSQVVLLYVQWYSMQNDFSLPKYSNWSVTVLIMSMLSPYILLHLLSLEVGLI